MIIVSNSGINSVPVEMAEIAKENNHPVISITSKKISETLKSRSTNGLHLYDVSDVVIDNHSKDDTVDIIKEYKLKVVFCDKNEINSVLSTAIDELNNEWFILLKDNEILPYRLLAEIEKYILNPKKNKNANRH